MSKAKVEIIYQDDDIIVVNKPSGVSVTYDRSGAVELVDILERQLGARILSQLRLVHRLDKDTSGVMILARNKEAQSLFSGYFEKKQVKKTYLAIVTSTPTAREGTIDAPLAPYRKNTEIMCIDHNRGKQSTTNWKLLADFGSAALLAVEPLTGRTHQIRVHLPSIGLPLAIDPLYGKSRYLFLSDFKSDYRLGKGQTEKPLIDRLTLHAYQIQLLTPSSNCPEYFIARLDKKFAACLKMLTKYNPKGLNAFLSPDNFSKILSGDRL